MVESEGDMKVDLLRRAQMIQSAGIQELARTSILGVIANIFHEQAGLLGYLFFDRKGGLRHALGRYVRGTEELGQHTAHAPTFIQLPRPWQLQVRLRAAARYVDRAGRKRHADDHGQVDLPRYRTDLPLYRRSSIRKPRTSRSADVCKIRRQIQQQLQARRYAHAPSGICAVDRSTAVPSADIHSILTLKAAHRHDEAGVRDVRPVRCDFVFDGRTSLRLCVDRAENRNRRQQTYLESSSAHENLDRRTTGWRLADDNRTSCRYPPRATQHGPLPAIDLISRDARLFPRPPLNYHLIIKFRLSLASIVAEGIEYTAGDVSPRRRNERNCAHAGVPARSPGRRSKRPLLHTAAANVSARAMAQASR